MLEIKNLVKSYGDNIVLNNLSLNIGRGLNFVVGSSGSGKTTLLKILAAMDNDFEGELFFDGIKIKDLKSRKLEEYYRDSIGFIWQDFNLIDDNTVLENIKLPLYIKGERKDKEINELLKRLKIDKLAEEKVKNLSGGQRQRVAIARAIIKNPDIIIADEPTAALDRKSAEIILSELKRLANEKIVIIVTHDKSIIEKSASIVTLDKGELVNVVEKNPVDNNNKIIKGVKGKFSLGAAKNLTINNMKSSAMKYITSFIAVLISSLLLVVNFSGAVETRGNEIFDQLISDYGENILDIGLYSSFIGAAGMETDNNSINKKPSTDVKQDISKIYDDFKNDERINYILVPEYFDKLDIRIEGKNFNVISDGNAPAYESLLTGTMPKDGENEVVVPQSFVKKNGFTNENILGKNMEFTATLEGREVKREAKIVGVVNNTITSKSEFGEYSYDSENSFFFSTNLIIDMRKEAGLDVSKIPYIIRCKDLNGLISLKDEFEKKGIMPIGHFELIEDIVGLSGDTSKQSFIANKIIVILSIIVSLMVTIITAMMRKKEYSIYKINGYSKKDITRINLVEGVILAVFGAVTVIVLSPLFKKILNSIFMVNVEIKSIVVIGSITIIVMMIILSLISSIIASKTDINSSLKTGER